MPPQERKWRKPEFEVARNNPQVYNPTWWEGVGIETFAYDELGVGPVGLAKDLFGDGSVLLVSTPGHSAGHCSVLVRSSGKSVLLAGDCCYSAKNWKEDILPGHMVDPENALKSLKWLKDSAGADKDLIPISDHEPDQDQLVFEFLANRFPAGKGRTYVRQKPLFGFPYGCLPP